MKKNKRITLIVHNLSGNPIVRAYPIALALERLGYEIEIVGFLIGQTSVYKPYADKYDYKTVYIGKGRIFEYFKGLPKLLKQINGDIIYAFKPLMTSFFVGLIKSRFGMKKKLLFDCEDEEMDFTYKNTFVFLYSLFFRSWKSVNSHRNLILLHLFLFPAKIRTVVSSKLQKRYGGEIVLHGPDELIFDPLKFEKLNARTEFNLPHDKIILLFAGMPHEYKGINMITDALLSAEKDNFIFVGAGPKNHKCFIKAKVKLGNKCILLGELENDKMPKLLAAVDVVPILQKKTRFTESQIPAKLLEAMAMGKIIIGTDTSDIGIILGKLSEDKEKRGYLIEYADVKGFTDILKRIEHNPQEAYLYSQNARNYYLKNASTQANAEKLKRLFFSCNIQ